MVYCCFIRKYAAFELNSASAIEVDVVKDGGPPNENRVACVLECLVALYSIIFCHYALTNTISLSWCTAQVFLQTAFEFPRIVINYVWL